MTEAAPGDLEGNVGTSAALRMVFGSAPGGSFRVKFVGSKGDEA